MSLTAKNKRHAIIVLGMHRSGTSALAGVLYQLGINLSDNLLPPQDDNKKGFWEHKDIYQIHEKLLKDLHSSWDDVRGLPDKWWTSDIVAPYEEKILKILQRDFSNSAFWGIKDPRICRLLLLWKPLIESFDSTPYFIIIIRNPIEVAASLAKREGFSREKSLLLWLTHLLESEKQTRGHFRTFVTYAELLSDWKRVMSRVQNIFKFKWPVSLEDAGPEIKAFLDEAMRHNRATKNGLIEDKNISKWIREAYFAMPASSGGTHNNIIETMDAIEAELKEGARLYEPVFTDILEKVRDLKAHLAERDKMIGRLNAELAERDKMIGTQNAQLVERDKMVGRLNAELAERDGRIFALLSSTSWKITAPVRFLGHQRVRLRRMARLALGAMHQGGGFRNTFLKTLSLFKREGLAGIKYRLAEIESGRGKDDYARWIRLYDTLDEKMRKRMRSYLEQMENKPLISVIMPVYNPKPKWLSEAIESVRAQIYPNWELCIADDCSTDPEVKKILRKYQRIDSRIKVVFRKQNGHISAASNSGLELVGGEWVALLDHDDLLSEHALFWVADAINQNQNVRLIYSDEDKVDANGKRFGPYFKSDWNIDLFYSHNMFSHLGVYRVDLMKAVGGFREGMEGSQDYDLALRCMEQIKFEQILHIPRVLYHWRVHAESTAQSADAKPYAMLAGERALNEHFKRQKINARAELIDFGYRIRYALPDPPPLASLIILTKNGLKLIRQCVESILNKTTYPNYEILIVDNGSDHPGTLKYLDSLKAGTMVRVVRDDSSFNYSALNNAAVKRVKGEVIGLLNNDLEVITPEWLSDMVSIALQPQVGAVGARLWYPNETLQHGGVILGVDGIAGHSHKNLPRHQNGYFSRACLSQSFSALTAACLVIRKSIYEEVGGLNETELKVAFSDIDFCLRLREAGYRNVWTPFAELYHHESATRGLEDTFEKQVRFAKEISYMKNRWGEILLNDPYYNPNLTIERADFSLAWPPRVEWLCPLETAPDIKLTRP